MLWVCAAPVPLALNSEWSIQIVPFGSAAAIRPFALFSRLRVLYHEISALIAQPGDAAAGHVDILDRRVAGDVQNRETVRGRGRRHEMDGAADALNGQAINESRKVVGVGPGPDVDRIAAMRGRDSRRKGRELLTRANCQHCHAHLHILEMRLRREL